MLVIQCQEFVIVLLCDAMRHPFAVDDSRHDVVTSPCLIHADFRYHCLTSTVGAVEESLSGHQLSDGTSTDGVRILSDTCLFLIQAVHFLAACFLVAFILLGYLFLLGKQAFLFYVVSLQLCFHLRLEVNGNHILAFQHLQGHLILKVLLDDVVNDCQSLINGYPVGARQLLCRQLSQLFRLEMIIDIPFGGCRLNHQNHIVPIRFFSDVQSVRLQHLLPVSLLKVQVCCHHVRQRLSLSFRSLRSL